MKKILLILTLILVTLSMFGCSKTEEKKENQTEQTTTQQEEVKEEEVVETKSIEASDKYKDDFKVTLSTLNDTLDIYMPTNLIDEEESVIIFPYTNTDEEVEGVNGKDYDIIKDEVIDGIMVKLDNEDVIYSYLGQGNYNEEVLKQLNPDGPVITLNYKDFKFNYTSFFSEDMYNTYIIFDVSKDNLVLIALEGNDEFSEEEIIEILNRISYKPNK